MLMSYQTAQSNAPRSLEYSYAAPPARTANPIAEILAHGPIKCLRPHEQLFRDGEEKTNIFHVLEGSFVLYRLLRNGRRQVTGFAVAGDVVGLGAGKTYRCTAEASRVAKVRALPAIALNRLANENSGLGMRLYDAMSQELATAEDLLMAVGRLSAAERVATFLLGLANGKGRGATAHDLVELPMTRCDIADFLGLTTETVSRVLTKLADRKIIARHQSDVCVLDREALEDVAAGDLEL